MLNFNEIKGKISRVSDLVIKTDYNVKISEIKDEIPKISDLVKKTDYNAKINDINNKTPNINDLILKNRFWCKNIRYWRKKKKVYHFWLK